MEELLKELKIVEDKLDVLLNMGNNNETLVDERRRLQKLIRDYELR